MATARTKCAAVRMHLWEAKLKHGKKGTQEAPDERKGHPDGPEESPAGWVARGSLFSPFEFIERVQGMHLIIA